MRLLHLIDLRNVGGVEKMFADFLAYHPAEPIEHLVLTDYPAIAPNFAEGIQQHSTVLACSRQVGPFSVPKKPRWLRPVNRERLIRRLCPDLILVWNQFPDYRQLSDRPTCPVIYYEHGFSWYDHQSELVQAFFQRVNQIITVSDAARRMLQLKHHIQQPVTVIHNALRPSLELSAHIERKLPVNRPLRLGSAARMVSLKCLSLLILTVKVLCERGVATEAWIAGDGPQRPILEQLIVRYQLQDAVRLLGLLDDMTPFYQNIDLCLIPSMHEAFSLACVEAQAWGIPVIAANVDGLPEANPPESGGLCLTPDWSPAEYQIETNASIDFARLIYDPVTDSLTEPKILRPDTVADAVLELTASSEIYTHHCAMASRHAHQGTFDQLCATLYQTIQQTVQIT